MKPVKNCTASQPVTMLEDLSSLKRVVRSRSVEIVSSSQAVKLARTYACLCVCLKSSCDGLGTGKWVGKERTLCLLLKPRNSRRC